MNIIASLLTLILGAVIYFPCSFLFDALKSVMVGPLAFAICFLLYGLLMSLLLFVICKATGIYRNIYFTLGKQLGLALLLSALALPVLSGLLEFVYELDMGEKQSLYVYMIDNSSSMDVSDPENKRYGVVADSIKNLPSDSRAGVYVFDSEYKAVQPIGSIQASDNIDTNGWDYIFSGNATMLLTSIQGVINDKIDAGINDPVNIVVVTDGAPSDLGEINGSDFIKECKKNNVAVSIVAFATDFDQLLYDIVEETGGSINFADDISGVNTSLQDVMDNITSGRDLISERTDHTAGSVLYAIMRVLFLILIGLLVTYIKSVTVSLPSGNNLVWGICIGCIVLGSILIELIISLGGMVPLGRALLFILFTFIPLPALGSYSGRDINSRYSY